MFFVYVVKNEINKIYIGQTNNLIKRLARHNKELPSKKSSYTSKQGAEWHLVYIEKFSSRKEAMIREKQLKSYQGRKFLKNILAQSVDPPTGGLLSEWS